MSRSRASPYVEDSRWSFDDVSEGSEAHAESLLLEVPLRRIRFVDGELPLADRYQEQAGCREQAARAETNVGLSPECASLVTGDQAGLVHGEREGRRFARVERLVQLGVELQHGGFEELCAIDEALLQARCSLLAW